MNSPNTSGAWFITKASSYVRITASCSQTSCFSGCSASTFCSLLYRARNAWLFSTSLREHSRSSTIWFRASGVPQRSV